MKAKEYVLNVRFDGEKKEPLTKVAKKNRRSINKEINIAVDNHLKKEKSK